MTVNKLFLVANVCVCVLQNQCTGEYRHDQAATRGEGEINKVLNAARKVQHVGRGENLNLSNHGNICCFNDFWLETILSVFQHLQIPDKQKTLVKY